MSKLVALLLVLLVVTFYLGWFTISRQRNHPHKGKVTFAVEVDTNQIQSDTAALSARASALSQTLREKVTGTETVQGTVREVLEGTQRFTLATAEAKELLIQFGPATEIRVRNSDTQVHPLHPGDQVTVVYKVEDGQNLARSVSAAPGT